MVRMNLDVPPGTWISNDSEAADLLCLAMRKVEDRPDDFIGFDIESHAKRIPVGKRKDDEVLDWMSDTVTFWSLAFTVDGQYKRYCLDQPHFRFFTPLLENPKAKLVTWNGKYDAHVSWNSGVNVWESDYMDFQVCGQMVNENVQPGGMKLKQACIRGFSSEQRNARRYLAKKLSKEECGTENQWMETYEDPESWVPIKMTPFKELFELDIHGNKAVEHQTSLYDLSLSRVVNYSSLDSHVTLVLAEHLKEVMLDHKLHYFSGYDNMWEYYREFEAFMTEILWRMERRGIGIAVEKLREKLVPMEKEQEDIQKYINRFAGRPVNLNSRPQVRELLFGKGKGCCGLKPLGMTPGGSRDPAPKTDEKTIREEEE